MNGSTFSEPRYMPYGNFPKYLDTIKICCDQSKNFTTEKFHKLIGQGNESQQVKPSKCFE